MMRLTRILGQFVSFACALALMTCVARADDVKTQAPATQPSGARDKKDINADFTKAFADVRKIITSSKIITDPAKRAEVAPKAIPALKKLIAVTNEMAESDAKGKIAASQILPQWLPILATFDDSTQADLEKQAADPDAAKAISAKSSLLCSKWWRASNDGAAQAKLIDESEALAKANPENSVVARTLIMMSQMGASSTELTDKLETVVVDNMKGTVPNSLKQRLTSEKKLHETEGKPCAIAGKLVDGSDFTTDSWKGKVILVDFWATWCGPCKAELPRVKKAYADFHDKGFEIVGVSNDYKGEDLKNFVAADPAMPWPQLFDPKAAADHQWNPLTLGYGIHGIPTMFLIDKKGVCRTVKARENFEELIPKMLAE
jgi:thiol-disulfide isomerase/thioredoxin